MSIAEGTSQAVSRYLEAIFYMEAEGGAVRASRLADWLGVSQPTASITLRRMVRDKLVEISTAKVVSLTAPGRHAAARIVRKHRIAERWLTDVLGLDWIRADEEAGRLEHALSDDVADRLHKLIGEPATCPHGNPIPGTRQATRGERPLTALPPGQAAAVRRVSEVAEHEAPELLGFLRDSGLHVGAQVKLLRTTKGAGIVTVVVGRREVAMALEVADKVWVDGA